MKIAYIGIIAFLLSNCIVVQDSKDHPDKVAVSAEASARCWSGKKSPGFN